MEQQEERVPVEEVQRLASEGRSEREIITTLRSQGFSNEQVAKALNRVLKFTVGGDVAPQPAIQQPVAPPQQALRMPSPPPMPRVQGPPLQMQRMPAPPQGPLPPPAPQAQTPPDDFGIQMPQEQYPRELEELPSGAGVVEMTAHEEVALEELIEEVINEKWKDVEAHLAELDRLYGASMERMDSLEGKLNEMMDNQDTEKAEMKTLLTETSESLQSLEGRVSSVERAFKDFLPALTDNVRELARIVEGVKTEKKGKK
ncbi:MAG: hypothetical protein HYS81_00705 [Candidatus Aenigmatarchaeota archaeon]|nr:MAG: hypothetical protein HYS81_00705 [Candidatus Aenigmarchaeota archaeon]